MNTSKLFSEFRLNKYLTLKNRIVMAPLTRAFASDAFVPNSKAIDYYARRSDAGLIITEGTIISENARGQNNVPGIFTRDQINAWQKITDKVHHNKGLIFNQIWHVGRVSHPSFLNGQLPVSASNTVMTSRVKRSVNLYHGQARGMNLFEIKQIIDDYKTAAINAIKAGFDGIEIHGANGYLIDQFLHCCTNLRTDNYGGSPKNMARFVLEIIEACGQAIGFERVGLRLSPGGYLHEIVGESKDAEVFQYLLQQLNDYSAPIAYVHTGNFDDSRKFVELNNLSMSEFIRKYYSGVVIACGGYNFNTAIDAIENKKFDLIAFGRPFIANPDLIKRLSNNQELENYHDQMLQDLN